MALSGIRDMSTLEEPPADRQPVQTYVLEHDWGVLADAMRRELERGCLLYTSGWRTICPPWQTAPSTGSSG